jgi:hypothetical protein
MALASSNKIGGAHDTFISNVCTSVTPVGVTVSGCLKLLTKYIICVYFQKSGFPNNMM